MAYLLEKEDYIAQLYTDTLLPDEMFTQTLLMNSPFASTVVNKHLRYICWEHRNGNRPAVLDESDFARVLRGISSLPVRWTRKGFQNRLSVW